MWLMATVDLSREFVAGFECRCVGCDDMIRVADLVVELAGEVFHAECT